MAVQQRDMFNRIDTSTGWKVDLIVRKDRPFSVMEFEINPDSDTCSVA